jgi:hypothetical protein
LSLQCECAALLSEAFLSVARLPLNSISPILMRRIYGVSLRKQWNVSASSVIVSLHHVPLAKEIRGVKMGASTSITGSILFFACFSFAFCSRHALPYIHCKLHYSPRGRSTLLTARRQTTPLGFKRCCQGRPRRNGITAFTLVYFSPPLVF